ncbi:hypothetical protein AM493_17755 [Flavobacterium akiainvivens]|uniref:Membrane or secreted protein n=1 Tax=Flavobacterium akiainvivens TaxID=1202724 RepID=A0A0M9VJP5_9FLAO|nr:hypothetical protein [Flavobacterium akiainvivens]KOS07682.1 hypothetical protein AM493_17755 [Flavobacterium akiainvivens]SFQ24171.1 hypothetical protein SAMN05444144_102132 [Flavobacterium akiainvivens]
MKRKIVLLFLLAFPLMLYVYFSMVKHNSLFLPIVTKEVADLPKGKTANDKPLQLKEKISIVGFLGNDVLARRENIFNINQKLNAKYRDFEDFQMVMLVPEGKEAEVAEVSEKLKSMADITNWKFLFAKPEDIKKFYVSLNVVEPLAEDGGSGNLFIIDKKKALRGRKGKNKAGVEEYKDCYNSLSPSELSNEMTDDLKIVLREYRLALRRNGPNKREI